MSRLNIIVLVKQVPDTRHICAEAMTSEGTVNRAALPTVFNPDDLKALEMALSVRDRLPGSTVTVITMGPQRAAEVVREALNRGADDGFVLCDPKFAGADTLATSYALALAAARNGRPDVVFCGRQAIDGDTAQVGPQVAEKLGLNQVTCADGLIEASESRLTLQRGTSDATETVAVALPALVTVGDSAPACRPPHIRRILCNARIPVTVLDAAALGADTARLGHAGSATRVVRVESVVLAHTDTVSVGADEESLHSLLSDLRTNHII